MRSNLISVIIGFSPPQSVAEALYQRLKGAYEFKQWSISEQEMIAFLKAIVGIARFPHSTVFPGQGRLGSGSYSVVHLAFDRKDRVFFSAFWRAIVTLWMFECPQSGLSDVGARRINW